MLRQEKVVLVDKMTDVLQRHKVCIILKNDGICNNNINTLRCDLHSHGGIFFTKNNLFKIAISRVCGDKQHLLNNMPSGSIACAYSNEPTRLLKNLFDFCQGNVKLSLDSGYYEFIFLDKGSMRLISGINSINDLYVTTIASVLSPVLKMGASLNANLCRLSFLLNHLSTTKDR